MSQQKILVVDDELGIRNLIENILTPKYKVYLASTCPKGFVIAVEKQPDLIILDLTFPEGQNGYKYCKKMKKDIRIKHIPIIMLTGQLIEGKDELKGLKLGAEDYITKPFDNDVLIERIKKALESKKDLKEAHEGITVGNIYLQHDPPILYIEKKRIGLTSKEHGFLYILLSNHDKVVKYEKFYKKIWDHNDDSLKKPLTRITERVRNKLSPNHKDMIKTIKNTGYVFDKEKYI